MTREQVGKLLRLGGAAATVGVVACVHAASDHMPLGQIMALRACVSGLLIVTYALAFGKRAQLAPRNWHPHVVRGLLACLAMALSYIAAARLPVTQAQTLAYLAPLFVVPLAVFRAGETLTRRLAVSLLLGFAGVLMVLGFSISAGPDVLWGALAGIGGAALVAVIQVKVRRMTATETALSISLSFTIIVSVVTAFSALAGNWIWPTGSVFWIILSAGIFGAINLVLFAESLARAPASVIAPLDYTGLLWAVLVDWLLFFNFPGPVAILGSLLITLSALSVVLDRRHPAPPADRAKH
jgi:drug/metabolite transporter (DMT)-like permease